MARHRRKANLMQDQVSDPGSATVLRVRDALRKLAESREPEQMRVLVAVGEELAACRRRHISYPTIVQSLANVGFQVSDRTLKRAVAAYRNANAKKPGAPSR